LAAQSPILAPYGHPPTVPPQPSSSAQPAAPVVNLFQQFWQAPTKPAPAPAARPAFPTNDVKWNACARSVEGRPIEYAQFGVGLKQVLVIGALDGDKPEGVAVAESLANYLAHFPGRADAVRVTIIRDPNPDGRRRGRGTNAHNVALDKNFPTASWRQASSTDRKTPGALSDCEPETRALVDLLTNLKPDRVIVLSTAAGPSSVTFAGPADTLARQVAIEANARLVPIDLSTAPSGSLLTLTGVDQQIPTLVIGFVPRAKIDDIWSDNRRALLTAIGCGTPVEFPAIANRPAAATEQLVPVYIPGLEHRAAMSPSPPATQNAPTNISPTSTDQPPGFDPRVERLPPVNIFESRTPRTRASRLPQTPIPAYPDTGY
jgi:hypothetical protein